MRACSGFLNRVRDTSKEFTAMANALSQQAHEASRPVQDEQGLLPFEIPVRLTQAAMEAALKLTEIAGCRLEDNNDLSTNFAEAFDRSQRYLISRFTLGLSPAAVAEAYFDWMINLAGSPGKQFQLVEKAFRKFLRLAHFASACAIEIDGSRRCIEPLAHDKRFAAEAWQSFPFNIIYQSFLLQQQWLHVATTGIRGVSKKHDEQINFIVRQWLDVFAPSNYVLTNPEVLEKTRQEAGWNLVRGMWNLAEDWERSVNGRPPAGMEAFKVGGNIAVTPGKVVYRNSLIELIQYDPVTPKVTPEPILIVPAWIMKYYVLDLSPENSLVRYLVGQGFTVFMISWKNPNADNKDTSLDDYRRLGVEAALGAIRLIVPGQPVHGVGYCLGGTLLAIAAAALARNGGNPFKTLSLLAAQVDFEEAGELTLFITESEVAFLEDMMREQGYLDAQQMAGAFRILNSNDLIWSRGIRDYLMGVRRPMTDLMAWNADATRMPYRMHSDYLRRLFLNNDLAEGRLEADGRPIALTDIAAPVFAVGTEHDHVAPWNSVFKLHLLLDTDVTFLLANGGHNAGIVSEPGHKDRHYRVRTKLERDHYIDPQSWLDATRTREGSWWPEWVNWLSERSGASVSPPRMGLPGRDQAPLGRAPGTYVLRV